MTAPGLPAAVLAASLVAAAVAALVLAREMRAARPRPRYCSLTDWLALVVLFGSLFVFMGGELGSAQDDSLGLSAVLAFVIGHVNFSGW